MIADRVKEFELALHRVKRSKKYGRFRVYKYKNGRVNLFEWVKDYKDGFAGHNDIRVQFGSLEDAAKILAEEYKGKP